MFTKFYLNYSENLFNQLSNSINFEKTGYGRQGANLALIDNDNNIPIVRTTTVYKNPIQNFLPIHNKIINDIKNKHNVEINNAMVEIYETKYKTMGFHSDQALDLQDNSFICIFSCYNNPETKNIRKLVISEKNTNDCIEIFLDHNSVIMFSTETNKNYVHKIILDTDINNDDLWLGITFRMSKTLIKYDTQNEKCYFTHNNKELLKATPEEKKEFYKLKSIENKVIDFVYPEINYMLS